MVTPDLKLGDNGALVHVDLGAGRRRLGASALAQAYSQLGDSCPDVAPGHLKAMWETTQSLIAAGRVSAGHDISDGGIATTLLEMGFAGVEGRYGRMNVWEAGGLPFNCCPAFHCTSCLVGGLLESLSCATTVACSSAQTLPRLSFRGWADRAVRDALSLTASPAL